MWTSLLLFVGGAIAAAGGVGGGGLYVPILILAGSSMIATSRSMWRQRVSEASVAAQEAP